MYTSSSQYTVGPYTSIVQTLSRYKTAVPIGFLAERLGAPTDEMRDLLANLESEGVVEREGDRVSLARHDREAASAGR